jgi:hypothetical protein
MAQDAIIRVRLDTAQAERDLQRLTSAMGQTGRMGMGGGGGGGGGPIGGGGGGGGLGLGGTILGTALGFSLSPYAQTISNVIGGAALSGFGLGGLYEEMQGPLKAKEMTMAALGMAGRNASEQDVKGMYRAFSNLTGMEAEGRGRVANILGGEVMKEVGASLAKHAAALTAAMSALTAAWLTAKWTGTPPEVAAGLVVAGAAGTAVLK